MKIEKIRIKNFKGFFDSGFIELGKHITVLVGENNAGKTAFLESLGQFTNKPYKGPIDSETLLPVENPTSEVEFDLSTSGKEVYRQFLVNGSTVLVAIPQPNLAAQSAITDLFDAPKITWHFRRQTNGWFARQIPSHDQFRSPAGQIVGQIAPAPDKQSWQFSLVGQNSGDLWGAVLSPLYDASIFTFKAERLNVNNCPIQSTSTLSPDASNLPSVFLQLQGSVGLYERYNSLVRTIFPNVYGVAARPTDQQHATIFVTNRDSSDSNRAAVSLSLSECGTGIGQVLAMLYVVVTSEFPKVIVIDEPNSFLHPGAVKKLLAILKDTHHQYIISTHSADIITALNPDILHLIKWQDNKSTVHTLDHSKTADQRRILDELDIKLSDVFGADSIIWVEGATEERCFPILMAHVGVASPAVAVVSVIAPSELTGGKRVRSQLILEIYDRLSKGSALVPPAVAISLDRDDRSADEMVDLKRHSKGLIRFLPRRAYENFLLDSDAIAATLQNHLGSGDRPSAQSVLDALEICRNNPDYFYKHDLAKRTDETWISTINAPQVLLDLFNTLSDTKVSYSKTIHGPELTRWLLAYRPESLSELLDYVSNLVKS